VVLPPLVLPVVPPFVAPPVAVVVPPVAVAPPLVEVDGFEGSLQATVRSTLDANAARKTGALELNRGNAILRTGWKTDIPAIPRRKGPRPNDCKFE
jgi:hypothetical protein